ncbi:kinase-like domain-containing protein [Lentinula edodes]|nr:kinase-like domain-containing protein [Lentinula edodes]
MHNYVHRPVLLLSDGTVVKVGNPAFLQLEAEATKYARDHTQLPIPRVYDFFTSSDGRKGYLVMQHMPGDMLQRKWRFLSSEQRNSIMAQVRNMIEELRAIRQPEPQGWIGSSSCGPFRDFHIRSGETYGPFASEADFNNFRMGCFANFSYSEEPTTKERLARIGREMPVDSDIVFTHGDITRRNLLVDDNAKVVGIVDWEQAGWRPAYWEKVKIHFGGGYGLGVGYEDDIAREVELHLIHGGGSM